MLETAVLSEAVPAHATKVVAKPLSGKISVIVSHPRPNIPSRLDRINGEVADITLALDRLESIAPAGQAIRQELARILQSPIFVHSDRLSRFLRFVVEHVVCGNQTYLKEYVIGSEVYDRRPPYSPSQDSIVRTEARRLRGKLKEYYETEGKDDPVCIYLRPGSYIPAFRYNATLMGTQTAADVNESSLPAKTPVIAVGILPFRDISSTPLSAGYANGIPD